MSEERSYRGVTIRRRLRQGQPHGWWLMPEGPLKIHPDKGWVPTLEQAHAEIDGHLASGACLLREHDRWKGALAASSAADSMFDRSIMRGFSGWCAARHDRLHEPCSTRGCPCDCHRSIAGRDGDGQVAF